MLSPASHPPHSHHSRATFTRHESHSLSCGLPESRRSAGGPASAVGPVATPLPWLASWWPPRWNGSPGPRLNCTAGSLGRRGRALPVATSQQLRRRGSPRQGARGCAGRAASGPACGGHLPGPGVLGRGSLGGEAAQLAGPAPSLPDRCGWRGGQSAHGPPPSQPLPLTATPSAASFRLSRAPAPLSGPLSQPPQGVLQTEKHLGEIEILASSPAPRGGSRQQSWPGGSSGALLGPAGTGIWIWGREPGRGTLRAPGWVSLSAPPPPWSPWAHTLGSPDALLAPQLQR